ncbi:MAG: serine--tRNA ligase [Halieaceae bacterium]|nr:serine--tRNA ligase [Halieaceae bacterium]
MLSLKLVRKDPEAVALQMARRGAAFDAPAFQALDACRKQADISSQSLQAERNAVSRKIGKLVREGMDAETARLSVQPALEQISMKLDQAAGESRKFQQQLEDLLMSLPNIPAEGVPDGRDERDNRELSRWGEPANFDFPVLDHVELGEKLGGIDFDAATRMTGARFVVLSGAVARLHRALIQFMLDIHISRHGYQELNVPYIVNADSLRGVGQLPKFEDDLFKLRHHQDFYLIPTAEVPVTNMLRGRIVEQEELEGLRYVCHSPCFRSEAGSYGKDTRGMIRLHQFEKVELVRMTPPQLAEQALEELTAHAETILQMLELPYRKVILCTGYMGFSACKTFDLEVWLPAQNTYREISSCSHFSDYQARRIKARWRNSETGKPELLHTLNGSGLAVGRTLVAILENFQCADGSVDLPAVLQPYLGGMTRLGPG